MADFGPPPPLTHDELVALLRRNFEQHWIEGLLADATSASIFEGIIAALLRVSAAGDEDFGRVAFILSAFGAASSETIVRLQRPLGAAGTIPVDRRFQDQRGATWVPIAEVAVAASLVPQTVDVAVRSERAGYWLDSFEPLAFEIVDPLFDPTFVVIAGPDPATGGKTPSLDQHGKERRVFRAPGEDDRRYRNRIRFLEDQVSPTALASTIPVVLDASDPHAFIADLIFRHGLRALREPFRDPAQPPVVGLSGEDSPFFDDPRTFYDDAHGHVLRGLEDCRAHFDVFLPAVAIPEGDQQFYDDSSATAGTWFDDPELGYFDVPASLDVSGPIAAMADELDRRRAGGVLFHVYVGGTQDLLRHAERGGLVQAGSWADQAGATTGAALAAALASFEADDSYAASSLGAGAGLLGAAGDLEFSFPAFPAPLSISHVVLRAWARRVAGPDPDPALTFSVRPTTAGGFVRLLAGGFPTTVDHDDWREYVAILEQNPVTAAPWTLADVGGAFRVGIANAAAVGATDQLRISELTVEIFASYD